MNKVPSKPHSLVKTLIFYLALSIGLVSVLISSTITFVIIKNAGADMEKKATQLSMDLPAILELPMWQFNETTITSIGNAFVRDKQLVLLKIARAGGGFFFEYENSQYSKNPRNIGLVLPVSHNSLQLGSISIELSRKSSEEGILPIVLLALAVTALILAIVFFSITMTVSILLKKPFADLSVIAATYGSGGYGFEASTIPILEFQPFEKVLNQLGNSNFRQLEEMKTLNELLNRKSEEVRLLNVDLECRVEERTLQLETANKELEAFSYSVSHDLRAPLRHIDGYIDLLLKYCRESLSEKGRHYADTIAESARHMGQLVDDLLQFSRMGRAELRRDTMDMNQVLKGALEQIVADTAGRSIEWVIEELPVVQGDASLFRQVWINLLGNAAKYTRKCAKARIMIGVRDADGEYEFSVADNGVGFDMKYAAKLFGVFQRLHSQEEFEGTGIGLAIVQRIIGRHGGRVWAMGALDQGATFYFTLPKIPASGSGEYHG